MTVVILAAALLTLFGVLIWAVKRWGRAEAQNDVAATELKQVSQAHAIDEAVSRLDDRTLDRRLRDGGE